MADLDRKKVLLGLSGGVDSATAALLLSESGYSVTGYYFDNTGHNQAEMNEAIALAAKLGIEIITEDVSAEFENIVIKNFISEYLNGRTPNPCIICNPLIKFARLLYHADRIGAYYIATGHYADITESDGIYYVSQAANIPKDQSYMLYRLGQEVLSRLIFPLGKIPDKDKTREIARNFNLENAEKKDSQEICFVDKDESYISFIEGRGYMTPEGNFTDTDGNILGKHSGILHYTIGQRKGLGIALGKPAYVVKIDKCNNNVTLGDNDLLFTNTVVSTDNVFTTANPEIYNGKEIYAKIRYSAKPAPAILKINDDKITTEFYDRQRAVTPGQSIVFYVDNKVIGGGIIHE